MEQEDPLIVGPDGKAWQLKRKREKEQKKPPWNYIHTLLYELFALACGVLGIIIIGNRVCWDAAFGIFLLFFANNMALGLIYRRRK